MTKTELPRKGRDLEGSGYTLFKSFRHQDLVAFILPYMKKKNKYLTVYKLGMYLPLLIFSGTAGYIWGSGAGLKQHLEGIGLYLAAVILLIPTHELIHGIAYKWVGAPKVSYGVVWKKLAFYAQAHDYVVKFGEFRVVALAPFVIINLALLSAMLLMGIKGVLGLAMMMFLHNGMCAGDFALLSFFHENRDKQLVTYDDADEGKTYFYTKSELPD